MDSPAIQNSQQKQEQPQQQKPPLNPTTTNPPQYTPRSLLEEAEAAANALNPPPDYETTISAPPPQTLDSPNETLRITGKHIFSSLNPSKPIYRLSHALDGHELSHGILVSRVDPITDRSRDIYALRDAAKFHIGPANYEIDGARLLGQRTGYMSKILTRNGSGWTASAPRLPTLTVYPQSPSFSSSSARDNDDTNATTRVFEWRNRKRDVVLALEPRRRWDAERKRPLTEPMLELLVPINKDEGGGEFRDFLVAAWCMWNWREAKEFTKEPLTWSELKQQARTTAAKRSREGWNPMLAGGIV
ncbi:hypothetical protein AJ80_07556 [Polytolypa hystricis UAMH7299]|uniref:Uncharacterized protein n=1 Tax=Polytolypa hystricis (strain UAMH7299) TaxID=1447883 RepID=A0A2B7XNS2_POLH7|nr:hypothetical protein AJ80_07556 [Polytolypa hystricis UAMH7299]